MNGPISPALGHIGCVIALVALLGACAGCCETDACAARSKSKATYNCSKARRDALKLEADCVQRFGVSSPDYIEKCIVPGYREINNKLLRDGGTYSLSLFRGLGECYVVVAKCLFGAVVDPNNGNPIRLGPDYLEKCVKDAQARGLCEVDERACDGDESQLNLGEALTSAPAALPAGAARRP